VLSLALGIFLFVVVPARATAWLGFHDRVGFGLVDGAFRLLAFMLYCCHQPVEGDAPRARVPRRRDKAIHALENRRRSRPRACSRSRASPARGTSFLFLVVVVSVVVFTFIGKPRGIGDHLLRIACMPLIAGVAFEFIRFSGRHAQRPWVRALIWRDSSSSGSPRASPTSRCARSRSRRSSGSRTIPRWRRCARRAGRAPKWRSSSDGLMDATIHAALRNFESGTPSSTGCSAIRVTRDPRRLRDLSRERARLDVTIRTLAEHRRIEQTVRDDEAALASGDRRSPSWPRRAAGAAGAAGEARGRAGAAGAARDPTTTRT